MSTILEKNLAYYQSLNTNYGKRIVRGLKAGFSVSQARGHAAIGLPSIQVIAHSKKPHGWIAKKIIKNSEKAVTKEEKIKINNWNKLFNKSFKETESDKSGKVWRIDNKPAFEKMVNEIRDESRLVQFNPGESPRA